ncbi:septum formation initiator family protein [Actinotignum urinale]|uniref:FtsB family cell division protein n=1 Tax=Actinotignum urinale TaxID=190146 RepID=UPI00370DA0DF
MNARRPMKGSSPQRRRSFSEHSNQSSRRSHQPSNKHSGVTESSVSHRRPFSNDGKGNRPGGKNVRSGRRRARITVEAGNRQGTVSVSSLVVALFIILAVIIIIPTANRYTSQQRDLRTVQAQLSKVQEHNEILEKEKAMWSDPEFVKSQARVRLGYVVPGQRLYVAGDPAKGSALQQLQKRVDTVNEQRRMNTPWYVTAWDTLQIAGHASRGTLDNPNAAPVYEPGSKETLRPGAEIPTPIPTKAK